MEDQTIDNSRAYWVMRLFTGLLFGVMLVWTVLHPRGSNILLSVMLLLATVSYGRKLKKAKSVGEKRKLRLWAEIPALLFGLFLLYAGGGSLLNIIFSQHMPYEYRGDIAKLKQKSYDRYYFFPDAIPKGARRVRWVMMPSVLQGTGFEVLVFEADDAYIQEVTEKYSEVMRVGEYRDEPILSVYDKKREQQITVYELYDSGDWNHPHSYGFFTDRAEHIIGFYCQ